MRMVLFAMVMAPSSCPQHIRWTREVGCGLPPDTSDIQIVVAKHALTPGKTVTQDDLMMLEMPYYAADDTAFEHPDQVVGRVPVDRVLPMEALRPERFAPPEDGVGLMAVVGDTKVRVDLPQGASTVAPGDHVDLLITSGQDTRTLFQGLQVAAVLDTERGVVVALPRPDAERVLQALETGVPKLVLRSDLDFTPKMPDFVRFRLGYAVPLSETWR